MRLAAARSHTGTVAGQRGARLAALHEGLQCGGHRDAVATGLGATARRDALAAGGAGLGDDVVLDASGSYDADLDGLTYAWSQVSGATVQIINPNTISAFFVPTTSGTFEFMVTVSDGQITATDTVVVTVDALNQVPVAHAGSAIVATVGDTVTLDGTASYDPDGDAISFIWSQTSGTGVSLSASNTARPTFTAAQAGVYVFALTVYDGQATSSQSTVTVTVQTAAG